MAPPRAAYPRLHTPSIFCLCLKARPQCPVFGSIGHRAIALCFDSCRASRWGHCQFVFKADGQSAHPSPDTGHVLRTDRATGGLLLPFWIYYLFYIWVNLYGVLAVSLLWLLANAVFNAREARRLFGFIGTGGIAGSVLGGVFTGWAASWLGTENLLLISAALIAISAGLVCKVRVNADAMPVEKATKGGALQAIASSALLRHIAVVAGLVAVVAVIADIQFNEIVDAAFETKDEKTVFFGTFFAYLNGFSFFFSIAHHTLDTQAIWRWQRAVFFAHQHGTWRFGGSFGSGDMGRGRR